MPLQLSFLKYIVFEHPDKPDAEGVTELPAGTESGERDKDIVPVQEDTQVPAEQICPVPQLVPSAAFDHEVVLAAVLHIWQLLLGFEAPLL